MLEHKLTKNNWWSQIDKTILLPVLALILIGIIAIFSASQQSSYIDISSNLLLKKHLFFCFICIISMFILTNLSLKQLIFFSIFVLVISFILSICALIFFSETKGATRWLNFVYFSIQPSEMFKPSFMIISSLLLVRYKVKEDFSLVVNFLILATLSIILILQPDFGMFLLICFVWLIQLLTINLKSKILIPVFVVTSITSIICFISIDHVRFRIINFFFKEIGDNYQITKSLDSFKSGGFSGRGIGEGIVSKNLPDSHSDFIYALIGEEFGSIFALIILVLYIIPYIRVHLICQKSSNLFVITSLTGLSNIFLFQTIINISSSLNIIPTKGMTLPFVSYGGSSLISSAMIISFILILIREDRNE